MDWSDRDKQIAEVLDGLVNVWFQCNNAQAFPQANFVDNAIALIRDLAIEIEEIRGDLEEMSKNGGTGTQQDVCRYLIHRMNALEGKTRK